MKFLKYPSTWGLPLEVSATKGAAETLVDGTVKAEDRETASRTAILVTANTQMAVAMREKLETVAKQRRSLLEAEECSVDAAAEASEEAEMVVAAAAYQSCSTAEQVVIAQ